MAKEIEMQSKNLALFAVCLGFFMVIMDVTIVNVALPSIGKGLGGGISWLQWVVDGYTLTFACFLLTAGSLGDKFGAKTAFLNGLALFSITSLGCGLAPNFLLLITFRLLQGIAAALLVPTSLALIHYAYEDQKERAQAIGIWAGLGGIAAVTGPLLGAILTTWFGWRSVFFVNVPIGLLGFVLTKNYIQQPLPRKIKKFDFLGQIIGIISIGALAFFLIESSRLGWSSPIILMSIFIFLLSIILFLIIEHFAKSPMVPLFLFQSTTFSVATMVGMILNIGVYGELFVLSIYFQQIKDYTVLMTGFAFLPLLGIIAITSYFGGKITSFLGPKLPMLIGLGVGSLGFLMMVIAGKGTPYFMLILPLACIGFGIAFTMPAATFAVINSVKKDEAGIASGILNASRQIGSLIGVAIFGTFIASSRNFIVGMRSSVIMGSILFAIGLIITWLYVEKENDVRIET